MKAVRTDSSMHLLLKEYINKTKNVMRCRDNRSAKSRETGRNDSIKLFSIQPHPTYHSTFNKGV